MMYATGKYNIPNAEIATNNEIKPFIGANHSATPNIADQTLNPMAARIVRESH